MGERFLSVVPTDRALEQAIVALKKGAHIWKFGRRGKPKLCPFRLSTDERTLIWFSGKEEKQLQLSLVTSIIRGHRTRKLQPERESQSFSLVYTNSQGHRSLDLVCKDKAQADSWFFGLNFVFSRCQHLTPLGHFENQRGSQSCANSPASYIRRKYILGLSKETPKISQVGSISGSPIQSSSERCFSDGFSCSSDNFFSESSLSSMQNLTDALVPNSSYIQPKDLKKRETNGTPKKHPKMLSRFVTPSHELPPKTEKTELRDVLIWGEGVEKGLLGGDWDHIASSQQRGPQVDALLPKFLESTSMLDVENISLAGKHAALVTKQGQVFCWGEGKGGKLGHKVNMDISCPKEVDSLSGVRVKLVSCGEYQTCALSISGELYTWGENCYGDNSQWHPRRVSGVLDGITVSNISCGEWHTAIISASGQLFTFGDGTFGVLGHGNCHSITQPKQVDFLKGFRVKSVACGPWHSAAVVGVMIDRCKSTTVGKLFTWGDGDKGRLGHADNEMRVLPTCVVQLVDHDFVQVACGRMLTVGLTNTGVVYTMGSSVHGQLGNPQAQDKSITIVEGKLKFEFVIEIASGSYHVAALTSKGNVYTWGKGTNGQLGVGDTEDRDSPTLVESLRQRRIEIISCGSSSTAAICLHKPITCMDQSACRGCSMAFGFMRKKHNCYNCGLFFCSSCTRKKTKRASLAPVDSKSFRVCDSCFNGLQRSSSWVQASKLSPRPLLIKAFSKETEDRAMVTPRWSKMRNPGDKKRGEDKKGSLNLDPALLSGTPRWGLVSSPASFRKHCREDLGNDLTFDPPVTLQDTSMRSKSKASTFINGKRDLLESDKIITDEVEKLQAKGNSLEPLCHARGHKIEACQHRVSETCSLVKKEAVKRKAAKEVVKALTARLHLMSPKVSTGALVKAQVDESPSLLGSKCSESPSVNGTHLMCSTALMPLEVEDRQVGGVCGSPHVFSNKFRNMHSKSIFHNTEEREDESLCDPPLMISNKLKSMQKKSNYYNEDTILTEEPSARMTGSGQTKVKEKHEWVEQYEPGVFITFVTLPSGQRGLKQVRFSRKRFTEKEAESWWEENQLQVYNSYDDE